MQLEINIGLDVTGRPGNELAYAARTARALDLLGNRVRYSERFETRYAGPEGDTIEASLFVRLDAQSMFSVVGVVYDIALELEQDCIAIYSPLINYGRLIGPRAAQWGEFDSSYFVRATTDYQLEAA